MKIVPNGWQDFQHYKKRSPPWIKLHHKLLDNFEFQRLHVASKALAPMLWLIASEDKDGIIDADIQVLAFRLRWKPEDVEEALGPLIGKQFFKVIQFDSKPLALREQLAMPETEAEAEKTSQLSGPKGPSPSGPVFGEALALLVTQGMKEPQARTFLGMLVGNWEESDVLQALSASIGKQDAKSYALKILKGKPKKARHPPETQKLLAHLRQQYGDNIEIARDGRSFWDPSLDRRWNMRGERMASV